MSRQEISIAFQTDKRAADYIALAQLVDQYDFDAVSVYCDAPYHPSFPPLMLMAPHIRRARIGMAAISPSRIHPLDIAAQTALLADIAAGGVTVGVARGAWLDDHAMPELKPPVQAIREAIHLIRYMLNGQTGGYDGRVYQLAPHVRAPYPLPQADIPILVGTWGAKLGAVAGELADEVKVGGSANPDMVSIMRDYIRVGEERAGRASGSVGVVFGAVTVVDEDRQAARAAVRRAVALYLPVVAPLDPTVQVEPELMARIKTHVERGESDAAVGLISDDLLERFAFGGNVDDIIRQAASLFDAGASRVEFGTPHGLHDPADGIHLIGKRVIPALRSMGIG
ncbi:MAG: LLM class flavin-dependent oxidoreductase [Anaerolineaceae bacterium]|nr:MAG: LLM class flavin-dependent oxidoreductase [Anaerolineaceae bacterium]